jgi:hypothetical protein
MQLRKPGEGPEEPKHNHESREAKVKNLLRTESSMDDIRKEDDSK